MAIFSHTQYNYELQKNIIPVHYIIPLWFVVYCLGFNGNFQTGVIRLPIITHIYTFDD